MREKRVQVETMRAVRTISAATPSPAGGGAFAGDTPLVRRVCEQLATAAALRCPLLLVGEPGSGRTHAARWLHAQANTGAPFLALRGLPPRAGDALGAATVFARQLDEAPLAVQAEWRTWLAHAPSGVRVVASAASAWPLENADAALFTELRRFVVAVPALRERRDDLAAIVADMAREIAHELGAPPVAISPGALNALRRAHFLASAASLRHALERFAAHARAGETIAAPLASAVLETLRPNVSALRERERGRERDALLAALSEAGGNLARTARRLGRSRAAVYRLIAKHGVALGAPR